MPQDKREDIYNYYSVLNGDPLDVAKDCMDTYMRETCLELLEYLAKNKVECGTSPKHEGLFWFGGEWLTSKQLFENFL